MYSKGFGRFDIFPEPLSSHTILSILPTFILCLSQPHILRVLGINRDRLRRYTRPVSDELIQNIERHRPKTKVELNRIWYGSHNNQPQHYDNTRYHGVNLHNVWYRGTVEFRWFEATLHAGKIKAYLQFCLGLAAKALNGRAASSRKRDFDPQSAKYDFRVFLLHLGLIGDEFKTARLHLMKNMPGDAAFKNGRPKPDETETTIQTPEVITDAGSNPRNAVPTPVEWHGSTQTATSGFSNAPSGHTGWSGNQPSMN